MSELELERRQALEADIDARLVDVWAVLWNGPNVLTPVVEHEGGRMALASFLRTAYAIGYGDALTEESRGQRAELHRRHGYAHP